MKNNFDFIALFDEEEAGYLVADLRRKNKQYTKYFVNWMYHNVSSVRFYCADYEYATYGNFPLKGLNKICLGSKAPKHTSMVISEFMLGDKKYAVYLDDDFFNSVYFEFDDFKNKRAKFIEDIKTSERLAYVESCRNKIKESLNEL